VEAGASGNTAVLDGTIVPACAQACPAQAIVFGDVSDPDSRVSKVKRQSRNYSLLGELNTRPRTTYLTRVRNPNPRMPEPAGARG
jgi:molybdopterin-containing oxidoreductase family iron-sulfur binding subunit